MNELFHETRCPYCGKVNEPHRNYTTAELEELKKESSNGAAVSLCTQCGGLSMYTPDLDLREMTKDEIKIAIQNPVLREIIGVVVAHYENLVIKQMR